MVRRIHYIFAATLCAGLFTLFTGINLINALLVDLSRAFSTSVAGMGQLSTIAAVSWAILALLLGPFSDRFGHNRIMVLGLWIFTISLILFGLSQNIWMLVLSSILFGLGGALAGPNILTCVGIYFPKGIFGRMIALVTAATPLANLLGVPVAVFIAGNYNWRWSFLFLSMFSLISIILIGSFRAPPIVEEKKRENTDYFRSYREAFQSINFKPIILANTMLQGTFWVIATYFAAFLIESYSLGTAELAPLLSAMAVGQLAGTFVGGTMADHFNRTKLCAVFSFLLGTVGFIFLMFTANVLISILLGGLFMGFYSGGRPAFFSLMIDVSKTVRGTVMGIQATSNHLGRAFGAAVGGLMLSLFSYHSLGILCILLGTGASALYLFVYFRQRSIS